MAQRATHLVAVYPDEGAARSAADRLEAAGVDPGRIRVGRPEDHTSSVVAEMRQETDEAWMSPQAGFLLTKEMARGAAVVVPVLAGLGALFALALTPFVLSSLPVWARLIVLAGLGAAAGGAAGLILGAGEAEKGSREPLAAERGVAVRVESAAPGLEKVLAAAGPIRVDRVSDSGTATRTVATDEGPGRDGALDDLRTAWKQGDRRQ